MPRLLLAPLLALAACSNQNPDSAEALWDELQAADYHGWARAPGYEGRTPSATVHGDEVEIFINEVVVDALAGAPRTAWPDGSIIVKDGFMAGEPHIVVAMQKRGDAWFFAEYETSGEVVYSGDPHACTRCHGDAGDGVLAFDLPR
ncbi:hypothetical protein [Nannocystis pusilla]|uniref:Cytochrome P460 domain-containing protein n=1 Tax=Nannocystis pusilla TaxID=889268 RepID=A0ABS7U4A9_9BACT|nr:hypothetical protein [Nannocystis pusilla]MBZ5715251.1 hypothetical protein [Nannocystis pusilla]